MTPGTITLEIALDDYGDIEAKVEFTVTPNPGSEDYREGEPEIEGRIVRMYHGSITEDYSFAEWLAVPANRACVLQQLRERREAAKADKGDDKYHAMKDEGQI